MIAILHVIQLKLSIRLNSFDNIDHYLTLRSHYSDLRLRNGAVWLSKDIYISDLR